MCALPGMSSQTKPVSFDSRMLAVGREWSKEIAPREGSRLSDTSSNGMTRVPAHLSVDVQDAIIALVRKETAAVCDALNSKLSMVHNEVDYLTSQIREMQNAPSGSIGGSDSGEIPNALKDLVQKTTDALNTMVMHGCRLQEAENNLQEMASLQRELASKVQGKPELNVDGTHDAHELRLAKLESEFTELNGQYSRDRALFTSPAGQGVLSGVGVNQPGRKLHESGELSQVQGDRDVPETILHEPWLAALMPSDAKEEPVDSSQIQLEENSGKTPELGTWYFIEDSKTHSYEIFFREGEIYFLQDAKGAAGKLVRGSEWLEGHIKLGSIRMKLVKEGELLSQFKPDNESKWHDAVIATRDAPAVPKTSSTWGIFKWSRRKPKSSGNT